mgnify:CR=1 FL=1
MLRAGRHGRASTRALRRHLEQCQPSTLNLQGHKGDVFGVAFSPGGNRLATAGKDKTARIWNAETGELRHTLGGPQGHTDEVTSVAFSPDGNYLATASEDTTIRFWNVRSGRRNRILAAHTDHVLCIAFSPDGKRLASGGRDALAPLAHLRAAPEHGLTFTRVKTVAQLDAALANTGGKTAMLDFYADWCVSCKEMEKLTFVDPRVRAQLADTLLLQVDVTANDADDKAMLKRFNLFGPPGIILFDRSGREIADSRVIGYQDANKFSASLARLK